MTKGRKFIQVSVHNARDACSLKDNTKLHGLIQFSHCVAFMASRWRTGEDRKALGRLRRALSMGGPIYIPLNHWQGRTGHRGLSIWIYSQHLLIETSVDIVVPIHLRTRGSWRRRHRTMTKLRGTCDQSDDGYQRKLVTGFYLSVWS